MHISRKHYCDSLYSKIIGHFLVVGIFTGSAGMVPSEPDVFRGHFLTLVLDLALAKLGILIYFNFLKHSIFDYSDTSVIPVCICSNKILFVHCKWCFACCWRLRQRRWSGLPAVVQKQRVKGKARRPLWGLGLLSAHPAESCHAGRGPSSGPWRRGGGNRACVDGEETAQRDRMAAGGRGACRGPFQPDNETLITMNLSVEISRFPKPVSCLGILWRRSHVV